MIHSTPANNTNRKHKVKILEKVKIVVETEDSSDAKSIGKRKFMNIVEIESDGSFHMVQDEVSKIVNEDFANFKILEFSWNYV
jgi:ERCC4-related helicase